MVVVNPESKPRRVHPKMTKGLLDQIDTLRKNGHSTSKIGETLGITDESVERSYTKLSSKRRAEVHSQRGGAFAIAVKEGHARQVCTEITCPWRCDGKDFCVWPSCFQRSITQAPRYNIEDDTLDMLPESENTKQGGNEECQIVKA